MFLENEAHVKYLTFVANLVPHWDEDEDKWNFEFSRLWIILTIEVNGKVFNQRV